ncbi:sensor histidine kinase [Staphylococcus pseudintermedius]|uniref:sensor histidine kinase n=1 Tax=Staphylococcus pseudintermedius TaxID=283734 RepID=UPI0011E4447C|nr:sensor histidine kinase [Staphylococcus pseudintermedius]EGQ1772178.1 sensor histidine kinase [Staphylococcus pseudintermedius]EJD8530972.1 sensor histidine kinase [Staphylococcus pseudintermedius]TYK58149.1 sensor histidine kinase [Staphylococcus pseudintermedius]
MKTYQPYRYQLRRSLFISTILPVFLVILLGLVSFYTLYIWVEHRHIHQHLHEAEHDLAHTENQIKTTLQTEKSTLKQLDLSKKSDVTTFKRLLLELVHQQPGTVYYVVDNGKTSITNNYEKKDVHQLYLMHQQRIQLLHESVALSFYLAQTPHIEEIQDRYGHTTLILDRFDNILYSNSEHFHVDDAFPPPPFGFISERIRLNDKGEQMIQFKDIHDALEDGLRLLAIICIAFVLLMIFGFMNAHRMAKRQTRDIELMIDRINQAQRRELGAYQPLGQPSELEDINTYIYELVESNETLIHSIEQTEQQLRKIQLKEIERQFQPHFLFNTMQTIQYLITLSPRQAQKVVQQLSQMLRYTLRVKTDKVSLKEELAYIQKYVTIQNIRFDDSITLNIDTEHRLENELIRKMMIHPLIENAIKHGRESEPLIITIRIKQTAKYLRIFVHDNGMGMTVDRRAQVRQMLQENVFDTSHLGLNHLNHKVQIQYGVRARLRIFSAYQQGTLIAFQLPREEQTDV